MPSSERIMAIFATLSIFLSQSAALDGSSNGAADGAASEDARTIVFRETVPTGLVFVEKEYLPPPYLIEADEDKLTINGREVKSRPRAIHTHGGFDVTLADDDNVQGVRRPQPWGPAGGRRGFRRAGFGGRFGGPAPKRAGEFATDLATQLRGNTMLLIESSRPVRAIVDYDHQTRFLELIVHGQASSGKGWDGEADEYAWVTTLNNQPLITLASQRLDKIYEVAAKNEDGVRAVRRLHQWSYPLTVGGMVICVFSLGHLLKSAPKVQTDEQRQATSHQWSRLTMISITLFVVMSSLDLTWTLLASAAGQMQELNPIGSALVDSPQLLVSFKLAATFLSAGILFMLRRHSQAQVASWWVCLLCTVLTMRWLVFNSMFVS